MIQSTARNIHSHAPLACETKLLAAPVAAVTESGVFEGYASLFGLADFGKDMVVPGAFAASLARRGARGVRMLWQHDANEPIGRWLSIAEDARGLFVRGKLNLAVARAREIHALMKEGAVDGLSIGFRVERARHDRATGLRRLERLDLWEISVVTFPMLPGARVSGVKRDAQPSPLCGGEPALGLRPEGCHARHRMTGEGASIGNGLSPLPARSARHPPPQRREGFLAATIRRAARRMFH